MIGTPERFHCGKQLASYVGLVPEEKSSGDRRRLGHISKQGNVLLRFLLVEAAQVTVRSQPEWRSKRARVGNAQTVYESEMALLCECVQKCCAKRA